MMKLLLIVLLAAVCAEGAIDFRQRVRLRWVKARNELEAVASNPRNLKLAADLSAKLHSRKRLLTKRFNACHSHRCMYWTRHGLIRNRRERAALRKLSACAGHSRTTKREVCSYKVMHHFRQVTRPGARGRADREKAAWLRTRRHLKALVEMEFVLRKGAAVSVAIHEELHRVNRERDALKLKLDACEGDKHCRAGVEKERLRLKLEEHYVRQIGRCARFNKIRKRAECARTELDHMKRRTEPALLEAHDERKQARGRENALRRRERARVLRLHKRASKCPEGDAQCTRHYKHALLRTIRAIRQRRNMSIAHRKERRELAREFHHKMKNELARTENAHLAKQALRRAIRAGARHHARRRRHHGRHSHRHVRHYHHRRRHSHRHRHRHVRHHRKRRRHSRRRRHASRHHRRRRRRSRRHASHHRRRRHHGRKHHGRKHHGRKHHGRRPSWALRRRHHKSHHGRHGRHSHHVHHGHHFKHDSFNHHSHHGRHSHHHPHRAFHLPRKRHIRHHYVGRHAVSHHYIKKKMSRLHKKFKACKTTACRQRLHHKRRSLLRRRSFYLRQKAKSCSSKKCRKALRKLRRKQRKARRKARRHQRARVARRMKACKDRSCRRRARKAMRKVAKRSWRRAKNLMRRCKTAACHQKVRARLRKVRRRRQKARRARRHTLKKRVKSCNGKHCHHLRKRLARLRRKRFHHANNQIRRFKARLATCSSRACHVRFKRRILRERHSVRKQLQGYRKAIRDKMTRHAATLKACKKTDRKCRRKAHQELHRVARELRWALERRMTNLRHAYRACKGSTQKRCQRSLARVMHKHARELKHMYRKLEKRVRHRVNDLRSQLSSCKSHACRNRVKRRLGRVFASLRRHLNRRIDYLRRRMSHCQTNKCKAAIATRLESLEKHLHSNQHQFRTKSCRSRSLLKASFRLCQTSHCRRQVRQEMHHCKRVRRRLRRKRRCEGSHLMLLKAKLRACKNKRCRAKYMRRMSHCHNVVLIESPTVAPKVIVIKSKRARRVHHRHLSCIDNLKTKRFLRREHSLKRRMSKCLKHSCLWRKRRHLEALYRHRRSLLNHRLRHCDHHRHRGYLKKRLRQMHRHLRHYRNLRLRAKIAGLRKKVQLCGNKAPCVHRLNRQIRKIALQLDSVDRIYFQLKQKIARCKHGLAGESCRKHVMAQFRREIYAKEIAMIRHLEGTAREKFTGDVAACQRNLASNPKGRATCIHTTAQSYSGRLSELRMRRLKTDLRRAVRECQLTADSKRCEVLATQEFEKDKKIAIQDSTASADALLKSLSKK